MDIVAYSLVSLLTRFTYTIQKYMANKDSLHQWTWLWAYHVTQVANQNTGFMITSQSITLYINKCICQDLMEVKNEKNRIFHSPTPVFRTLLTRPVDHIPFYCINYF